MKKSNLENSSNQNRLQRRGRTLAITVDALLESPRFKIAMDMYEEDPMLLRAILIELGMEAQNVAKYKIMNETMQHYKLPWCELKPYLAQVTDFNKYNIHWNMSEAEKIYYSKNPKGLLTKKEANELFRSIKKQLGMK